MAEVLEMKDGNCITPLGLFDLMDYVEEYMGVEVRQYIEEAIWNEDEREDWTEEEKCALLKEHYIEVLHNIDDVIVDLEKKLEGKRLERDDIRHHTSKIKKITGNEFKEAAE
ncbi:MAG: hypothetical protein IIZ39_15080 [Blautia sp.]|nr:hypothetical protein [Blautia sp.]